MIPQIEQGKMQVLMDGKPRLVQDEQGRIMLLEMEKPNPVVPQSPVYYNGVEIVWLPSNEDTEN